MLQRWEQQTWFGMECTYGDDRSLTNMLLRTGWRTIFDNRAEAWTDDATYRKFFKQQLRWKKSWIREGPAARSPVADSDPSLPAGADGHRGGTVEPRRAISSLRGLVVPGLPLPVVYFLGLYPWRLPTP